MLFPRCRPRCAVCAVAETCFVCMRGGASSASNPRFLGRGFQGRGNEQGERNLTAELEVARLEGCAGIFAGCEAPRRPSSYVSTYLPLDFQIFIFSYRPPTSASAPIRFGAAAANRQPASSSRAATDYTVIP